MVALGRNTLISRSKRRTCNTTDRSKN